MAVYTEVGDDDLRAFVALYDIGAVLSCKGIAEGVENSNYLLTTERGNFILTLYEKRGAREDLPFFIALLDHLARQSDPVPFRDGELPRLIDFYFACSDFLGYVIAIGLNAWCFEADLSFNVTKARLLVRHFQAARPLGADELAALPLLARGSALRFLLTRLYDWLNQTAGALVRPKDPLEYLKKLRVHRGIASPAAYGIDV